MILFLSTTMVTSLIFANILDCLVTSAAKVDLSTFAVNNQMGGLKYQLIWYALAATNHVVVQLMHYFDYNSASVHVSNRLLQSILLAVTNMIYIFK